MVAKLDAVANGISRIEEKVDTLSSVVEEIAGRVDKLEGWGVNRIMATTGIVLGGGAVIKLGYDAFSSAN